MKLVNLYGLEKLLEANRVADNDATRQAVEGFLQQYDIGCKKEEGDWVFYYEWTFDREHWRGGASYSEGREISYWFITLQYGIGLSDRVTSRLDENQADTLIYGSGNGETIRNAIQALLLKRKLDLMHGAKAEVDEADALIAELKEMLDGKDTE